MANETKTENIFTKIWNALQKIGLKLFAPFACTKWWIWWSNFRWRNGTRINVGIEEEDTVKTVADIRKLVTRIRCKFKWTSDGLDELFDSIKPPSDNYLSYREDEKLQDDCDGFHCTVFHCLYNNGIPAYLLSVVAVGGSHCILIFYLNKKWHIVDYSCVYNGFDTIEEAINNYIPDYITLYGAKEVVHTSLCKYIYGEDGHYVSVPKATAEEEVKK